MAGGVLVPGPIPIFMPNEPAFPALNAEVLNAMAQGIRTPRRVGKTTVSDVSSKATVECLVLNNTSASYDVHSIMAINNSASAGLTVTSDQEKLNFQRRPVFTVNVPATATDFPFVLLEPLRASGGIARAAIGGMAVCTVNVTNSSHEYANPTPGDHTKMTSGETGQARIIHKPAGTGNLTCAVYLVEQSGGSSSSVAANVRYGSFYCSVNGVVSPSPSVYGLAVGIGETATGVFTWRAHVFTNSAFGGMALGVWNAALPYNLLVNSIASDPIEYSVSGTVRGSVSGSIGFVYTNDGTLATNLKLIPYVSSGTSGTVFLTNFSFSAVIT